MAAQGAPQPPTDKPFSLKGPASFVLSTCAMAMHSVIVVSSNDQIVRFYAFEPRFNLNLEYSTADLDCRAHAMHCFAIKGGGREQKWSSYFAWGDDFGRIHIIPESTLLSYRVGSIGAQVAQVKSKTVASEHSESVFTLHLFTGWVTQIEFIPDLGAGALAVCSNDGNVVILNPLENDKDKCIIYRYEGHSLAVKCLAWVKSYRCIASSGLDRDILLWDPRNGHRTGRLRGHKAPVLNICYYDKNDMLFTLDLRYQLYIWAMNSQQIISQVNTDAGDPWITKHRFRSHCILINEDRGHRRGEA